MDKAVLARLGKDVSNDSIASRGSSLEHYETVQEMKNIHKWNAMVDERISIPNLLPRRWILRILRHKSNTADGSV